MAEIGRLLGAGKMAETFEYGEHALKLYRSEAGRTLAFTEAATLAIVGSHDLPVPQVFEAGRFGARWGLVMSRAKGEPLANAAIADPSLADAALDAMVALHLRIHASTEPRLLPLKARLAARIGRAPGLDLDRRTHLLARLAGLPDGTRLCHGDFHPFNIIGPPGDAVVIDWPDATAGPPEADACRSYLLLRHGAPRFADPYLDRYVEASGAARTDILAWLPVLAAARLCENVPDEVARLLELAGS